MDDLLHIWKKDLDDIPSNGSPTVDWIPAPVVETQPLMKFSCSKSNTPSTHTLPVAPPPILLRVDDEPMDGAVLDNEQSSDDDSVNGEVEYCPPDNDFLVIAELDWAPIEEGEDQSDIDEEAHSEIGNR